MKKLLIRGISFLALAGIAIGFPSCKEDEPPAKPKMSFEMDEITVKESDREVEIKIILDKPASSDIEIEYSINGTANEEVKIGNNGSPDFRIKTDYLETEIKAGETEGIIVLEFISDYELEDDETIEISIEDVIGGDIEITREDETNITVKQEDGLFVLLQWGLSPDNYTNVDMDLFLWAPEDGSLAIAGGSTVPSFTGPEYFFLPTALLPDATYGISCTYYEGTASPMNFQVSYIEVVNGANATTTVKKGTYTLANINAWDLEGAADPVVVFTFGKAGADYKDFSEFMLPTSGSRMQSVKIPPTIKRK